MSGAIFSTEDIVEVNMKRIEGLKMQANSASDRRFRLCLHRHAGEILHQSVIVFCQDAYIRPHRHPAGKAESYQIIDGEMTVYFFDDTGGIKRTIEMGTYESGKTFFYRLSADIWHMPVPRSEFVVFHETSLGPYNRDLDVEFAEWSPDGMNMEETTGFLHKIRKSV